MHIPLRSIFRFTWTALFSALFAFPILLPAQTYQLLWEVKAEPSAPPSYLFGTMHVNDANMFRLPDSVLIAIENTEGFATEVAFDEALGKVMELVMASESMEDGGTEDFQKRFLELLGGGGEKPSTDPMQLFGNFGEPYEPGESMETFLDAFLYRIARDQGKVVGGLEEIDAQMKRLLSKDDAFSSGSGKSTEAILKNAYLKGDLDAIQTFMNSDAVTEAFRQEILIKRNYSMGRVADSLMRLRPTFIAVGAGHLPGEEGMVELFREMGYQMRPVKATYTGVIDGYLEQEYAPRWQDYEDDAIGLRLDVPVKPFGVPLMDGAVEMKMGMDLPGGFFYAFYRMQLPSGADPSMRGLVMDEVMSKMDDQGEDMDFVSVENESFSGREMFGESEGQFFRTRILFDEESMLFLLVGISEKVARGKAADHFMESVETYTPKSILEREWKRTAFPECGFAADFPAMPELQDYSDGDGSDDLPSKSYFLGDEFSGEFLQAISMDLPPGSEIDEDSSFLASTLESFAGEIDSVSYRSVSRNGRLGWETSFEYEGDSLHNRLVFRGLRIYLLTSGAKSSSLPSERANEFFDSFDFLPLPSPRLSYTNPPAALQKSYRSPPVLLNDYNFDSWLLGIDETSKWGLQDSLSGVGFSLQEFHVSPYFRFEDLGSLLDQLYLEDSFPVAVSDSIQHSENFSLERDFPAGEFGGPHRIKRLSVTGGLVSIAEVTLPGDFNRSSPFVSAFFAGLEAKYPVPLENLYSSKAELIMKHLVSGVDSLETSALSGLWQYSPLPEDFQVFANGFPEIESDKSNTLLSFVRILMDFDEDAGRDMAEKAFQTLNSEEFRLEALRYMLNSDHPKNRALGLGLLKEGFPKVEDQEAVEDFFMDVVGIGSLMAENPAVLKSVLAHPFAYRELVWSLHEEYGNSTVSISGGDLVFDALLKRTQADLDSEVKQEGNDELEMVVGILVGLVNDVGWTAEREAFVRQMMQRGPGGSPVMAAEALLEAEKEVSKSTLKDLISNNPKGFQLLKMLIQEEKTGLIPKKFLKHDFMAWLALIDYSSVNAWFFDRSGALAKAELLDEKTIWWDGKDERIYIFKCAFLGDTEWRLGICGPFPLKKGELPGDLEVINISTTPYSAARQDGQIEDLLERIRENRLSDWDFFGD